MTQGRSPGQRRSRDDAQRQHEVKIRLNDQEWLDITALADAMGVSRQRVYQSAVESGGAVFDRVAIAQSKATQMEARTLLRVLVGIGTNLNQIARGMHIDATVDTARLSALADQVDEQVHRLRALLDEQQV